MVAGRRRRGRRGGVQAVAAAWSRQAAARASAALAGAAGLRPACPGCGRSQPAHAPLDQLQRLAPARRLHGRGVPLHSHHGRAARGALQQRRKAAQHMALPAVGCKREGSDSAASTTPLCIQRAKFTAPLPGCTAACPAPSSGWLPPEQCTQHAGAPETRSAATRSDSGIAPAPTDRRTMSWQASAGAACTAAGPYPRCTSTSTAGRPPPLLLPPAWRGSTQV